MKFIKYAKEELRLITAEELDGIMLGVASVMALVGFIIAVYLVSGA
jgi:hypothetical protein